MSNFPVVEIFHSIQGEGINVGKPAIFVRFAGCDLNCAWCDTDYSESVLMTADQISDAIIDIWKRTNTSDVVFTGGNPCLHDFNCIMSPITIPFNLFIETQGTTLNDAVLTGNYIITVSPKFSSAFNGNRVMADSHINQVKSFLMKARSSYKHPMQLKLCISNNQDIQEAIDLITWIKETGVANLVYIWQPVTPIDNRVVQAIMDVMAPNHRLIPQIHKILAVK